MKKGLSRLVLFALSILILLAPSSFGTITFFTQLSDSGSGLHSIYPISDTTLTVCGTLGTIARSTDRGATWATTLLPAGSTSYTWYKTRFSSATRGFIAGHKALAAGYLYRSTDGGATWTANYNTNDSSFFFGIFFKDENTGWVAAGKSIADDTGRIYRTTNGGDSWTGASTTTLNKPVFGVGGFTRSGADHVFAVGNTGLIERSSDGGVTFSPMASGVSQTLVDVYFPSSSVGWAVGTGGVILKYQYTLTPQTETETWTAQTSGTTENLAAVYFQDSSTGWAAGANGTLLKTTDAGATWTAIATGTTDDLYDIRAYDADNIWVVGSGSRVILKGGTAAFTSISPASMNELESNKAIVVTGNFPLTGTYSIAISGLTVSSVTRVDSTHLSASLTAPSGSAGVKNIVITCPDQQTVTATNAFTVTNNLGPTITGISPAHVLVNERKNFTITGSGFVTGATVGFGSGYTIHGTIVNSPTQITVDGTLSSAGIRSVTVTDPNSGGTGVLGNSLLVIDPNASNPSPTSAIPGYAYRGTAFQAAIGGTGLSSVNSILMPGTGVTISIVNTSDTLIRANVAVDADATLDVRDLVLMSPTGGGVLSNALEVKAAVTSGKVVSDVELGPHPVKGGATVLNIQGQANKGNLTIEFPVVGSNGVIFARPSIYVAQPGRFNKAWNFKTDRILPIPNGIHVMKVVAEGAVQASKKVVFYQY